MKKTTEDREIEYDIYTELLRARENVRWLLDNPRGLIGFKGLVYWAEVVERLRKEIKL